LRISDVWRYLQGNEKGGKREEVEGREREDEGRRTRGEEGGRGR
jgi:hypothetical protein